MAANLPLIRSHERIEFKRCVKKWYWHWRMGLQPKAKSFGALELGTWMHAALAKRYTNKRKVGLYHWLNAIAGEAIRQARIDEVPEHLIAQAQELAELGLAMAKAYDLCYGKDPGINVIDAEVPLEFEITDPDGVLVAVHKLKPDLVYEDESGGVWLMEHKTAKSIRTEHLVIDDQARPYVAMAELALRKSDLLQGRPFRGVMYNFLRKAVPDQRPMNAEGKYLNKNGSVSKSQPPPYFQRYPVELTRAQKAIALRRLRVEATVITSHAKALRDKSLDPTYLQKTPHNSCPKFCQYFTMCVAEEQGGDIKQMQRTMYTRQNPYTYDEETTDVPITFDLG